MIPVELLAVLPHHKVRLYIHTDIQTYIHTAAAVLTHRKVMFLELVINSHKGERETVSALRDRVCVFCTGTSSTSIRYKEWP